VATIGLDCRDWWQLSERCAARFVVGVNVEELVIGVS
jgi:hypothetical protein